MIGKWIKAEVYDGHTLTVLEKGIAQGSVISPKVIEGRSDAAALKKVNEIALEQAKNLSKK